MKKLIPILLFLFSVITARSQDSFSFETGVGVPTFGIHLLQSDISHSSRAALPMEINYLRKVRKHTYIGAKLFFQQYSFIYNSNDNGASYSNIFAISNKSNYLFIAPDIDFGLGPNQYIHFYLNAALGFLLTGKQTTFNNANYNMGQATNVDTVYNSTNTINKIVFHLNFGFEEHVEINNQWHILLNEGFSLISSNLTILTDPDNTAFNIHPGFFILQVGIMKKYHKQEQNDTPQVLKP